VRCASQKGYWLYAVGARPGRVLLTEVGGALHKTRREGGFNIAAPGSANRLDLEMQVDERKDEALDVLHNVIEHTEALRILALLHVEQRAYLCRLSYPPHRGIRTAFGINEACTAVCRRIFREGELTVKEICSSPSTISSSWRPTLSAWGQLLSSSLEE